ncbi:2-hydroxyhepta-2,4-diene-1,7-dioate isomerase [miscellaneous Crenarchaeota group archaeon SMTZ-80]|nr:MAG: 2-hydroxyhepta-2,4-diene-1,7-dioate isomerase [miscellaneous Crenarchaeota group archaeon SMTZ-80]
MSHWLRFEHAGQIHFGTLEKTAITVYEGDMFNNPTSTAETLSLDAVKLLTPTVPSKMIAMWNNFHALAEKMGIDIPPEPLYLFKAPSSFLAGGEIIRRPKSYEGKVAFEGELGIVIGKRCKEASEAEAVDFIFGYTCINDVTAVEILNKDKSFAQWCRAKSYDTFGVFGPVVATGLNPYELLIKTHLDGQERQNFPVSDMIFQPALLVSLLSQDMTLFPGDVIACGTSVGVGSMKPGSRIEVTIEGIGTLSNIFE